MSDVIKGYFSIALLVCLYMMFFGDYSYKPVNAYNIGQNIGRGIIWPKYLFQSDPEIDGSSESSFKKSLKEVLLEHEDRYGQSLVISSIGNIAMLKVIEDHEEISRKQIHALVNAKDGISASYALDPFYKYLSEYADETTLNQYLMEKLDGDDFIDIIDDGKSAIEDIIDIADERD